MPVPSGKLALNGGKARLHLLGKQFVCDDLTHAASLSRDWRLGQRIAHALAVEVGDCRMDGLVECGCVSEGLVREVIEPHRVFRRRFCLSQAAMA